MRTLASALVTTALVAAVAPAFANGRFPAASHVVVAPREDSFVVVRTTFGLVLSKDHGVTWDWSCESAAGYADEDPPIAITGNGTMVMGLSSALVSSANLGCTWNVYGSTRMIDVAIRPWDPDGVLAITESYAGRGDAGLLFENTVLASSDNGATWSALPTRIDPTVRMETIDVSVGGRIYVSATRISGANRAGALFVSDDSGASWTEHAIPLVAGESAPYIGAVDPQAGDRIYVRTSGTSGDRLLLSTNGGASFVTAFTTVGPMLGFTLSSDATKVYLGGPKDGLYRAPRTTMQFTKVSTREVTCLAGVSGHLWSCTAGTLGGSYDDGATFFEWLEFKNIRGPVVCTPGTAGAACAAEWPALRRQLGIPDPPSDGGPTPTSRDAGPLGDASGGPGSSSGDPYDGSYVWIPRPVGGCSCDAAPVPRSIAALGVAGLAALFARRRRR
jgi:MYXO-CTERM domain-containing protein